MTNSKTTAAKMAFLGQFEEKMLLEVAEFKKFVVDSQYYVELNTVNQVACIMLQSDQLLQRL